MFYANTRVVGRFQFNLTCKNCQTKSRFTHFQKNYMKIASQCNLKPWLSVETAMHFLKIHKSVLCKIKIDLLYLWDVYDVNLWEKKSAEVQVIHADLYANRHSWRINKSSTTFWINGNLCVFLNWMRWDKYLSLNFLFETRVRLANIK